MDYSAAPPDLFLLGPLRCLTAVVDGNVGGGGRTRRRLLAALGLGLPCVGEQYGGRGRPEKVDGVVPEAELYGRQ